MKRLLSICLLVTIVIAGSSFTTNSEGSLRQKRTIRVTVIINEPHSIPGTTCVAIIHISLAFDFNTDTGGVSNVNVNQPTISVNCNATRVVNFNITTLNFDSYTHVSALEFSQTTDNDANKILSDPGVISDVIADMDSQIDSQIK